MKLFRFSLLSIVFWVLADTNLQASALSLRELSSPKGVAIVAAVYSATAGISNFLWSFRWYKHAGFSNETSAQIQEAAGISAAVECWILGLTIPLMVYSYTKHHTAVFPMDHALESAEP